jgi:hypothetical protein
MSYFPRMLDKIRLHARGDLPPDYQSSLGKGADGWCLTYLRVNYDDLRTRVLAGGTDEEILQWCFERGRKLEEVDLFIWNSFAKKLGWKDVASPLLERLKRKSGLADRTDILTMFDYFDADEGRGIAAP